MVDKTILEKRERLLTIAKEKDKGLAIGIAGIVNAKHYPMLEYDGISLTEVAVNVVNLRRKFGLHQAAIYSTTKGFHVRFFYDHLFTFKKIKEIVEFSESDPNYKNVVKASKRCINRVTGKYKKPDIFHVMTIGNKSRRREQLLIGNSLKKLFETLQNRPLVPMKYLMEECGL